MITEDYEYVVCDEPGCSQCVKNHRWGRTKADGWFFARDDTAHWCPDHIPGWVMPWRARRAR